MSFATAYSRALIGVQAIEVIVETHLSSGLPGFAIVGLPEAAVKESKERVRSAILNAGLEFPARRITVNLAPADLPKTGGKYDLAIALSILAASGQIENQALTDCEVFGELALDGSLRKIQSIIPAIVAAKKCGRHLLLPEENLPELSLVGYGRGKCSSSLNGFVDLLAHNAPLGESGELPRLSTPRVVESPVPDVHIKGQAVAKRSVQIAASGAHHLLLVGPPGSGKTLLANTLSGILPELSESEALELAGIKSVAGMPIDAAQWLQRPLRAPHHSATGAALVGGGNKARPGEISLAHQGVLFLDELTEFKQGVLDSLREPLESGEITVSRANYRIRFPARFQLMAAMNPCPCGYAGDERRECRCSPERVRRYLGKLSGPMLDRLDMIVEVPSLSRAELLEQKKDSIDWRGIRERVRGCRELQYARGGKLNALLDPDELEQHCALPQKLRNKMVDTMDRLGLSVRATHRVLKVARTIADYGEKPAITEPDLWEAISLRRNRLLQSAFGRL